METVTLNASPRTNSGKGPARRLRAAGKLPVVAYGDKIDTQALAIERDALKDILMSKRGRNTIIKLEIDGSKPVDVMVKEYTVHPVSRLLLHADFIQITENTSVECEVPFVTTGKSKGEQAGGTLLSNIRSLKVRCLPTTIPDQIVFDVSELEIDDVVQVSQLTMPEGVEPLLPPERKVLIVVPPRVVEATEEVAGDAAEGDAAEGAEAAADGDKKEGDS